MHPKTKEQLAAKALNVEFEMGKPYDPSFVKKILESRDDVKNGKGVKIAIEDLWK